MGNPTTGILDAFTASNGTELAAHNANWVNARSNPAREILIQSNQAQPEFVGSGFAFYRYVWNVVYGPASEAYATLAIKGVDDSDYFAVQTRLSGTSDATYSGYAASVTFKASGDTLRITRIDAGAETALGADVTNEVNVNDVLFFESIDNTHTLYINGVQKIQRTDATYTSSGRLGVDIGRTGSTNITTFDGFGGGTRVAPISAVSGAYLLAGVNSILRPTGITRLRYRK